MKHTLLSVFIVSTIVVKSQTCTALYSYGANFTNVHFFNQSTANNAHYYWNFGDGTGSNLKDPIHEYTENGTYLVTLYVYDTVSNCSHYFDQWLNITKYSIDVCNPVIGDSIYTAMLGSDLAYYLKVIDYSGNCAIYDPLYKVGFVSGGDNVKLLGYYTGNFITSAYYFDSSNALRRAAVKTSPNNYDRSKNYNSCSANFEMLQVSEDNYGQRILFKAMNKNATRYDWIIPGFGDPIRSSNDTISVYYFGNPNNAFPNLPLNLVLAVKEQNGCKDSLMQFVTIKTKAATYVGINKISNETLNVGVYPNPAKNKLNLEFEPSKIRLDKLTISNTLGQMVFTLNEPQAKQEIDLSFLERGIYFLKVQNKEGQRVIKIIKE